MRDNWILKQSQLPVAKSNERMETKQKQMALKLLEFLEQFMIFFIDLTQFEKTKSITFFVTLTLFGLHCGVCFTFNNRNAIAWKEITGKTANNQK